MKRAVYFFLIILLIGLIYFIVKPKEYVSSDRLMLGTVCSITVDKESYLMNPSVMDDAFSLLDKLNKEASYFDSGSELSRLNRKKFAEGLSDGLFFLIKKGVYYGKITGGAFDITVAPLVSLWGFYNGDFNLPSESEIDAVMKRVGVNNIVINESGRSVRLMSGAEIDLGGMAKGYGCDIIVSLLRERGVKEALVNIGGNIYGYGKEWRVGIKDPENKNKIKKVFFIKDNGISTSGNYEQYFVVNGKKYTHIINPGTGYPVENVKSVTVLADTAMEADIFSTAVFILGYEKGRELADNAGFEIIDFSY